MNLIYLQIKLIKLIKISKSNKFKVFDSCDSSLGQREINISELYCVNKPLNNNYRTPVRTKARELKLYKLENCDWLMALASKKAYMECAEGLSFDIGTVAVRAIEFGPVHQILARNVPPVEDFEHGRLPVPLVEVITKVGQVRIWVEFL